MAVQKNTERKSVVGFTEEQRAEVMEVTLEGMVSGKTLQDVVLSLGYDPSTVRRWLADDGEWAGKYRKARLLQGQAMAEEAIRVARETSRSSNTEDKLLIETLKWAASKANPQEYGEKQTVEHQGAQTLSVKIVEDDAPVRNPMALNAAGKDAVVSAIVNDSHQYLALPVGTGGVAQCIYVNEDGG
jgi:hypothetical protein